MKTARNEKQTSTDTTALQNPSEFLRSLYLHRRTGNFRYSTRAFARDLGMSQTLVSMIMSGKRPLTVKQAAKICVLLGFSKIQSEHFVESVLLALPENTKAVRRMRGILVARSRKDPTDFYKSYESERFKTISQWHHIAILDLTTTRGFRDEPLWIARRLGINPVEVSDAIARLVALNLLTRKNGRLMENDRLVHFETLRSEVAVRTFHKQMIGKALEQLERIDDASFRARSITSATLAIPASKWPDVKVRLAEFQKELMAFATQGDCDEVYQLNIQMFPLTHKPVK